MEALLCFRSVLLLHMADFIAFIMEAMVICAADNGWYPYRVYQAAQMKLWGLFSLMEKCRIWRNLL